MTRTLALATALALTLAAAPQKAAAFPCPPSLALECLEYGVGRQPEPASSPAPGPVPASPAPPGRAPAPRVAGDEGGGGGQEPAPPAPPPECRAWLEDPGLWVVVPCHQPPPQPEPLIPPGGATDAFDGLVPPPPHLGLPPAPYDDPPIGQYDFILVCSLKCPASALANILAEGLFKTGALFIKGAIRALEFAYTTNLFQPMAPLIQRGIEGMVGSVWTPHLTLALLLVATTGMLALLTLRLSQLLAMLLSTVLVLAGAALAFRHTGDALGALHTWSTTVAGRILAGVMSLDPASGISAADPPDVAAAKAVRAGGGRIWQVNVANPWALANFGRLEVASQYAARGIPGGQVLFMTDEQREAFYKARGKDSPDFALWRGGGTAGRLVAGLMTLVAGVVYGLALLVAAGAVLFFSLVAIVWAILAPVAFLAALVPFMGVHNLESWFWRLIGTVLGVKVFVAAVLSVVLVVSDGLFALAEGLDVWQLGWLLNLIWFAGLIWYHPALVAWFAALPRTSDPGRVQSWMARWGPVALGAAGGYLLGRLSAHGYRTYQERRLRAWAIQRLDMRAVQDPAYRAEVEQRVRTGRAGPRGRLRHDPRLVRQEMEHLRQIRVAGGSIQAELQPELRTASPGVQMRHTLELDRDVLAFRQEMATESHRYNKKVAAAQYERSLLGRLRNRLKGLQPATQVFRPCTLGGQGKSH